MIMVVQSYAGVYMYVCLQNSSILYVLIYLPKNLRFPFNRNSILKRHATPYTKTTLFSYPQVEGFV